MIFSRRKAQASADYKAQVAAESKKWGDHLKVEATGEWNAWTDHPDIAAHYHERVLIGDITWEEWVTMYLGHPAERSLDLGCGAGEKSLAVYRAGSTRYVEGIDVSEERIAEAERKRQELGIEGQFRVDDINECQLPKNRYDLIFSAHSFHHFLELEHIMAQVHDALTPNGLFILEEFVGPTQFQWTDVQIDLVRSLMSLIPAQYRKLRWNAVKQMEGRPTPEAVVAVSQFESIRSQEIVPLFVKNFDVVLSRKLGGTIQHLLYNGIAHNFHPDDPRARQIVEAIWKVEDELIDAEILASDFMLLVGKRRG